MDYENIETENPHAISEPAAPATPDTGNILGKISMILGFISLGTYLLGIGTSLSLPTAVASLICGYITKDYTANKRVNPQAKIGIICSIVQLILSILSVLAAYAFLIIYFGLYFCLLFFILMVESGMLYY